MSIEAAPPKRVGRPPRITREQVLRAGLDLADRDGLEAVSMRRLASALGVQAASLYNYVRTKEEVLDGAADLIMGEVDTSDTETQPWLVALERWARSYRACLVRHPNMVPWFARGARRGEQSLTNADRVYGSMIRGGWSPRDVTLIGAATINLVYGSALGSFAAGFPDDPADYPATIHHLANPHHLRAHSARIDQESFELGLRFHLEGLERLHPLSAIDKLHSPRDLSPTDSERLNITKTRSTALSSRPVNRQTIEENTLTTTEDELGTLPGDLFGYAELLDHDERALLARVRTFLAERVAPIADDQWERAEFPHHLIPEIAALGIVGLGIDFPDRKPANKLLTSFIAAEFARVDASMATFLGVHTNLAMGAIDLCGSEDQRNHWLPKMRSMELIGSFGLSEPQGGSDVARGLLTTARRNGDKWVLNGAKRWIGNATFADVNVIWARDENDGEVKGFVVEKGTPGFKARKIERKLALRTVQNADIELVDCEIPEENRLTRATSFRDTSRVLRATRGGVAWSAVGAMMGTYELARDYAIERQQFGRPIASFQLVQEHLATIIGNVTSSLALAVRIAQVYDQGKVRDEQAALVKHFCTARLRESVARAREIFGGNGIVLDYKIGKVFNDAEALYSYEGTREINTLIVGRALTGIGAFV